LSSNIGVFWIYQTDWLACSDVHTLALRLTTKLTYAHEESATGFELMKHNELARVTSLDVREIEYRTSEALSRANFALRSSQFRGISENSRPG
jgi:hypothetical protein